MRISDWSSDVCSSDLDKRQFVRSISEIAKQSKSSVIAEGIETEAELQAIRSLGIQYGQGYLLARPTMPPVSVLPPETLRLFDKGTNPKRPPMNEAYRSVATVRKILRAVPAVADSTATNDVYDIFQRQAELHVLAEIGRAHV